MFTIDHFMAKKQCSRYYFVGQNMMGFLQLTSYLTSLLPMNQNNFFFISIVCESSEDNKELGTWELIRFFSMESVSLKSQVDPT
jgi:hypothetical protein